MIYLVIKSTPKNLYHWLEWSKHTVTSVSDMVKFENIRIQSSFKCLSIALIANMYYEITTSGWTMKEKTVH